MPGLESSARLYARLINRFLEKMRPGYPAAYTDQQRLWMIGDTELVEIAEFMPEMLR
jgi:hypothetical protein